MMSFFGYKMGSKRFQKGVYRNEVLFLLRNHIKVRQNGHFYTTNSE